MIAKGLSCKQLTVPRVSTLTLLSREEAPEIRRQTERVVEAVGWETPKGNTSAVVKTWDWEVGGGATLARRWLQRINFVLDRGIPTRQRRARERVYILGSCRCSYSICIKLWRDNHPRLQTSHPSGFSQSYRSSTWWSCTLHLPSLFDVLQSRLTRLAETRTPNQIFRRHQGF